MTRVRARGEEIRQFILQQVESHPADIGKIAAAKFQITRQAVNKHLRKLTDEGSLKETGRTRARTYRLPPLLEWDRLYHITLDLAEDLVWMNDVRPTLGHLPDNVMNIWQTVFTEMFNNAIDHSGGTRIHVNLRKTASSTEMYLADDGVGIFRKIQSALGLLDERHAVLELSKGKLTTDPARHTGEGIFFASRMVDSFDILSGGVFFTHKFGAAEDWILEPDRFESGTSVWMKLSNHTARTTRKIYDQYASAEDDYRFTKTVVPVRLAQYGDDKLVSRSQAKRVLARMELFKTVIVDFAGVDSIGQAFADEMFRVFSLEHPEIELLTIHANSAVKRMIDRARSPQESEKTL
jgi:anti-sigma regulatory factor (Ser/Thr protein kinase)/biotin operon repressor